MEAVDLLKRYKYKYVVMCLHCPCNYEGREYDTFDILLWLLKWKLQGGHMPERVTVCKSKSGYGEKIWEFDGKNL